MKILIRLLFLFVFLSFVSCKKIIETKQRDLLIDAMTNGQWLVHQYMEVTHDITAQFDGYHFQFEENGEVHGIKGTASTHGTWEGDINNYSITSQFPAATDPVKKLNGTWKLTDSDYDYVKAEMITPGGKNILHLRKKP